MSTETWKKEFYPVNATSDEQENNDRTFDQKWEGLLPENLKRHGLLSMYGAIYMTMK